MGRPPKPVAEKQDQLILLRLTRREKRAIYRAAWQAGIPAATFVRRVALERAEDYQLVLRVTRSSPQMRTRVRVVRRAGGAAPPAGLR